MDHAHLRSLLVRCEPENRSAMYDSLKPYLRFTPKPLDVYISESAERAASQDLPTIDSADNINFSPAPTYEAVMIREPEKKKKEQEKRRPAGKLSPWS